MSTSPNLAVTRNFLSDEEQQSLALYLQSPDHPWYRVSYRHQRDPTTVCNTPCWTNFFARDYHGGIPAPLVALAQKIESHLHLPLGHFNVVSTRLYQDGDDSIAAHSDARRFLDDSMNIAQVTLGPSVRQFILHPVAPDLKTGPVVTESRAGDLLVMRGQETQRKWTHSVPPVSVKASWEERRAWRMVINYRRVKPELMEEGLSSFYRYCVFGDDPKGRVHLADQERIRADQTNRDVFPEGRSGAEILHAAYVEWFHKERVAAQGQTGILQYFGVHRG